LEKNDEVGLSLGLWCFGAKSGIFNLF